MEIMSRLQHSVFSHNLGLVVGLFGEKKYENSKQALIILLISTVTDVSSDSYSVVQKPDNILLGV